jgi:hypothetical protein
MSIITLTKKVLLHAWDTLTSAFHRRHHSASICGPRHCDLVGLYYGWTPSELRYAIVWAASIQKFPREHKFAQHCRQSQ